MGPEMTIVYLSSPAFAVLGALADAASRSQRQVVEVLAAHTYTVRDDIETWLASAALARHPRTKRVRLVVAGATLRGLEEAAACVSASGAGAGLDAILREMVEETSGITLTDIVPMQNPLEVLDTLSADSPIALRIYLSAMAARSLRILVMEMSEWAKPRSTLAGLVNYLADPSIMYRPSGQNLRPWPRTDRKLTVLPKVARRLVDLAMAGGLATPANRRIRPLVGHTLEAIGQGVLVAVVDGVAYNARGIRTDAAASTC